MCCIISGEPVESDNNIRTFQGPNHFQTDMLHAPCFDGCNTFVWFCGQFIPATCGITQCLLRKKILLGDMSKYSCFQGQISFCCIKSGACGEESCPSFCAFVEGCVCNFAAVSASRIYVMEKYDLASEPCDYRLIRINNCLQVLACICGILAIIDGSFAHIARIVDLIANLFYHTVSGCMTAQVSHEIDYQVSIGNANGNHTEAVMANNSRGIPMAKAEHVHHAKTEY